MGISTHIEVVYGVKYDADELENFRAHPDFAGKEDWPVTELWSECDMSYSKPFYDAHESDCVFLLGENFSSFDFSVTLLPHEMTALVDKLPYVQKQVREFAEKYNIENKESEVALMCYTHTG